METVTLIGTEQAERASRQMQRAADQMTQAAANMEQVFDTQRRFMDEWVERLHFALQEGNRGG